MRISSASACGRGADGAVADTLHFATHGPDGEIMDDYTTLPWAALCAEVAKVRISLNDKRASSCRSPKESALRPSSLQNPLQKM